ncbi:carboxylesterase family protein [Rubinisphaera margarita]|uniref:carboxylesterase family protein n=1 Tax=Rubinisphaera margarita TaxID=2909586 RepID=UPI001EE88CDD|nr:prolyl oligopeptidase family serine peptidase [Rubinisphaera margarita]MCG6155298.1 prolyl oligopeptidase family serine peptidase [Rubinisphaera margarita]
MNNNLWFYLSTMALGVVLMVAGSAHAEEPAPGKQVEQSLELTNDRPLDYWLYLPQEYSEDKPAPLMLFLHGRGERGDDLDLVLTHGPPRLISEGKQMPFIVASPQLPKGPLWWNVDHLIMLLDELEEKYAIDKSRIYVTGLSMGGFGTWELGAKQPERFAALIPVCGGGKTEWADQLANVPIWAFHGDQDRAVPVERTLEMVKAIQETDGDIKQTIYPGVAHDSWTQTYANPKIYDWLLSHTR